MEEYLGAKYLLAGGAFSCKGAGVHGGFGAGEQGNTG